MFKSCHFILPRSVSLQFFLHRFSYSWERAAFVILPERISGAQVVRFLSLFRPSTCAVLTRIRRLVQFHPVEFEALKTKKASRAFKVLLDDLKKSKKDRFYEELFVLWTKISLTKTSCARAWYVHVWWNGVAKSTFLSRITSNGLWKLNWPAWTLSNVNRLFRVSRMLSLNFLSNFSAIISAAFPLGHLMIGTVPAMQLATKSETRKKGVQRNLPFQTFFVVVVFFKQNANPPKVTNTENRLSTILSIVASISVSFMSPLFISEK